MDTLFGLDGMTAIALTGLVMGGAELVKRVSKQDWMAVITIVVSALIGGAAGAALGINPVQGIAYGVAASGYVALVQNVGKKSQPEQE